MLAQGEKHRDFVDQQPSVHAELIVTKPSLFQEQTNKSEVCSLCVFAAIRYLHYTIVYFKTRKSWQRLKPKLLMQMYTSLSTHLPIRNKREKTVLNCSD